MVHLNLRPASMPANCRTQYIIESEFFRALLGSLPMGAVQSTKQLLHAVNNQYKIRGLPTCFPKSFA